MIANYHTHTVRCGHAKGADREYVECAIRAGLKKLGFSDHVPVPFPGGFVSPIRMRTEQTGEYIDSLTRLRSEYRDDIELYIGFETEYYPETFEATMELLSAYPVDYLILGQHYLHSEQGALRTTRPTAFRQDLAQYVDQVIEGMKTGLFTYIAHPDTLNFTGDERLYADEMRRLCRAANQYRLPLEFNITGLREPCIYPCGRFFRIAAEEGCPVIMGLDAHDPGVLLRDEDIRDGKAFAKQLGLAILDDVPLVTPFAKAKKG